MNNDQNGKNKRKIINLSISQQQFPSRLILKVPRQWKIRKDKNKEYKAWENNIMKKQKEFLLFWRKNKTAKKKGGDKCMKIKIRR